MKLSLSANELLTQLQTVTRVASTRSAVPALSGVLIAAEETSAGAPRHRHRDRPARPSEGRDAPTRQRRAARPAAARRRALAARRRS